MSNEYREKDLVMGGDLSVRRACPWFNLGGARHFSLDMGCTDVGSPIGVVSIEVCNHGDDGVEGTEVPEAGLSGLTQPSTGEAWSCFVDNIETTALFARVVYDPTSGGVGAVFTNSAGTGSGPRICVKA